MDFRITMPRVMNMGNQLRHDAGARACELSSPSLPKEDTRVLLVVGRKLRIDVAAVVLDERSLEFWARRAKRPRWFHVDRNWAFSRKRALPLQA